MLVQTVRSVVVKSKRTTDSDFATPPLVPYCGRAFNTISLVGFYISHSAVIGTVDSSSLARVDLSDHSERSRFDLHLRADFIAGCVFA